MDVSAVTSPVASTESLPLSSDCFSSLSSSGEEWMDHDNSPVHTLKKKSKTGRGERGRGLLRGRGRGRGRGRERNRCTSRKTGSNNGSHSLSLQLDDIIDDEWDHKESTALTYPYTVNPGPTVPLDSSMSASDMFYHFLQMKFGHC